MTFRISTAVPPLCVVYEKNTTANTNRFPQRTCCTVHIHTPNLSPKPKPESMQNPKTPKPESMQDFTSAHTSPTSLPTTTTTAPIILYLITHTSPFTASHSFPKRKLLLILRFLTRVREGIPLSDSPRSRHYSLNLIQNRLTHNGENQGKKEGILPSFFLFPVLHARLKQFGTSIA